MMLGQSASGLVYMQTMLVSSTWGLSSSVLVEIGESWEIAVWVCLFL